MLFFGIALFFIYSVVPNPVMPSYSLTATLTFLFAAWLGFGYVDAEDVTQQMIGSLHAGGQTKYYAARASVIAFWTVCLSVVAVAYPILFDKFDRQPETGEALAALIGHAGLGMVGAAVSYLFTSKLVPKLSYAIIGLLLTVALSLAAGGIADALPGSLAGLIWLLPPVFPLMDAFNRHEEISAGYQSIVLAAPWAYAGILFGLFLKLMDRKKM
jgi:ABC-type transport system involved in cytochrome c biogenesis permease component